MALLDLYMQTTGSDLNAGTDTTTPSSSIPGTISLNTTTGVFTFTAGTTGAFSGTSVGAWVAFSNTGDTAARMTGTVATVDGTSSIITVSCSTTSPYYSTTGLGSPSSLTGTVNCRIGGAWGSSFAITNSGYAMNGTTPSLSGAMTGSTYTGLRVNILAGTYAISAATITLPVGLVAKPIWWRGYYSTITSGVADIDNCANVGGTLINTRGTTVTGSRPQITTTSSTQFVLSNYTTLSNLEFTGPGTGSANTQAAVVFSGAGTVQAYRCRFTSTLRVAIASTSSGTLEVIGCGFFGVSSGAGLQISGTLVMEGCTYRGAGNLIFYGGTIQNSVFDSTAGVSLSMQNTNAFVTIVNNTIYNSSSDGIWLRYGTTGGIIANNLFVNCSGYGINGNGATHTVALLNNAFANCTSGQTNSFSAQQIFGSTIAEVSSPFTAPTSHDFSLTSTALARQAGFPGQFEV